MCQERFARDGGFLEGRAGISAEALRKIVTRFVDQRLITPFIPRGEVDEYELLHLGLAPEFGGLGGRHVPVLRHGISSCSWRRTSRSKAGWLPLPA